MAKYRILKRADRFIIQEKCFFFWIPVAGGTEGILEFHSAETAEQWIRREGAVIEDILTKEIHISKAGTKDPEVPHGL